MRSAAVILILSLFQFNCVSWGHYRVIDLEPQIVGAGDIRVEGRSCQYFGFPFWPKLDWAIQDALAQVPGSVGLKNPEITDEFYFFVRCLHVSGHATGN